MYYVYKITNKVNGKVYIGKSGEIERRWRAHLTIASRGNKDKSFSIIHSAISKYGADKFCFEIIESFNSEQEALDREIYWISFYRSNISEYGSDYGYNLTAGGEGLNGFIPSEETRKKLSESCSGERNGFYNKTHTHISKQMMSESHSKITPEDIPKIYDMILKGFSDREIGNIYGVPRKIICSIRLGNTWKHVPRPSKLNDGRKTLTSNDVIEILKLIKLGISNSAIAEQFGSTYDAIYKIRTGKTWKNIPR